MSFAEGRCEDAWTFLRTCLNDAAEGAQAAENLLCPLPGLVKQEKKKNKLNPFSGEVNCYHCTFSQQLHSIFFIIAKCNLYFKGKMPLSELLIKSDDSPCDLSVEILIVLVLRAVQMLVA